MVTRARKDDTGKLRYDLLPPKALEALAEVYTVGAAKYGDRNWERGLALGRVYAAIQRHLWALWSGEDLDPEDGLHHAAHAAWGCFALLEFAGRPELDDRPKPVPIGPEAPSPGVPLGHDEGDGDPEAPK